MERTLDTKQERRKTQSKGKVLVYFSNCLARKRGATFLYGLRSLARPEEPRTGGELA